MSVYHARFSGICADCGDRYSVGADIAHTPHGWVHIECADNQAADPAKVHRIVEDFKAGREHT